MRLKAEPWAEPAEGAGTESPGGAYCVQHGLHALSGAMSWTCPRCQQPVFFGEARAEEGEKMGLV